jgi:ubiquinone/menaquinone biosynthesis C-methylase UbiE
MPAVRPLPVDAHLPFYSDLARDHSQRVLELACGTGQLTVPIAGLVQKAAGLDLSNAMLRTAQSRAAGKGIQCTFVEGDMRRFNLKNPFGSFSPLQVCFCRAAR